LCDGGGASAVLIDPISAVTPADKYALAFSRVRARGAPNRHNGMQIGMSGEVKPRLIFFARERQIMIDGTECQCVYLSILNVDKNYAF